MLIGHKHTKITKEKIRIALSGNTHGFKKGQSSWNKGKIGYWTGKKRPEMSKIFSIANKGRIFSEEHRKKLSLVLLGKPSPALNKHWKWSENSIKKRSKEGNPFWKGGISKEAILIRNSREQKDWAKKIKERDDFRCFDCGERGIYLESDHIYSWRDYPRLRLVLENGITLCKSCHKQKTIFERTGKYISNML